MSPLKEMIKKKHRNIQTRIYTCLILATILYSLSSYTILPISKLSEKAITVSHLPGLFSKPITLSIAHPENVSLYFSLNGSFPNENGSKWQSTIKFDTTRSIVFALYRNREFTDTFYTGTYIVGFTSVLPISSIVIPREDLFDSVRGIYVGGMREDGSIYGNCWKDIEKRAFFEYFDNGIQVLSQGCGLEIHGGLTRQNREKSLRVIAKEKYGKGKFKYKVFPTKEISSFNSLVLRTSGNDLNGTRFLDVMISSIAKDLGLDYLAYKPSVLFVNGEYWGIHNLREKISIDYLKTNHGSEETGTDILLGNAYAEHGSRKKYDTLLDYVSKTNPNSNFFIDSLNKKMDIDNFIRYSILQIHIVNIDSRGNIRFWRSKNLDDKYRWIYYDGDLSFANFNTDFLSKKISPIETDWYNPEWSTFLLRKLLANQTLRNRFITEYCLLLSTQFKKESLHARINSFKELITPEIERHVKRRNFNQSVENWRSHVNRLINFATLRESTAFAHLKTNFNLANTYKLIIDQPAGSAEKFQIFINNTLIKDFPYEGNYFQNVPFTVTAKSIHPMAKFTGWSDGVKNESRNILGENKEAIKIFPVYSKVEKSSLSEKIDIKSIGFSRWSNLSFVVFEVATNDNQSNNVSLYNGNNQLLIKESLQKGFTVLSNNAVQFKKEFPEVQFNIIESKNLNLFSFDTLNYYLMDEKGLLIQEILYQPSFSSTPYVVNNGKLFEATALRPDFTNLHNKYDIFSKINYLPYLIPLIAIVFLIFFYFLKKKKNSLTVILILCSLCLHSQDKAILFSKQQKIDISALVQSDMVETGKPMPMACKEFVCTYASSSKPLNWIKPFNPIDTVAAKKLTQYTLSYFKEIAGISVLHPRLKTKNDTVSIIIPGIKNTFYLLDSLTGEYLLEVEHFNSIKSWYYPVCPFSDTSLQIAKEQIGLSPNGHYWQLRFKNTSIDLTALMKTNTTFDEKGIFIENLKDNPITLQQRYTEFRKNYKKDVLITNATNNFSKDLERQMNNYK